MLSIVFPVIDPVIFSLGPLSVRWYALAYIVGFVLGWRYCMALAGKFSSRNVAGDPLARHYDAFMLWSVIAVILGGRLGYVLFYNHGFYLNDPMEALRIWNGGMSFHGGMLGVLIAAALFARYHRISFFGFADLLACAVPIGLGFGRVANFVNGELFGRATDLPWGVVFPRGGELPRHPSQLYEAGLEGAVLFVLMATAVNVKAIRERRGLLSGIFLAAYGAFRFAVEFVREPDPQLGFLFSGATMGQLLCVPMLLFGGFLIVRAALSKPECR